MRLPDHTEIHDLELKKKLFSISYARKLTMSGRTPVIEDSWMLVAIDPDSGVPRALIRRPFPTHYKKFNADILKDDLPLEAVWDWPKDFPADFIQGVNFVSISFAVHGDHLFLLKCQHSLDGLTRNKNMEPSLDKLSLLCYGPGRRDAIEVPLTFNAEVLAQYGLGDNAPQSALQHPEYDALYTHFTSAGLFFEFSDRWPVGRGVAGPKPGILHLPWADVNDWLTRHGHAPIAAGATPGAAPITKPSGLVPNPSKAQFPSGARPPGSPPPASRNSPK